MAPSPFNSVKEALGMPRLRFIGQEAYCITFGCSFDRLTWVDAAKLPAGVFGRLCVNPTFEADPQAGASVAAPAVGPAPQQSEGD
jgi:hypothetical protein